KCRFLFGIAILVLISLSFLLYAYQTEHLAYDQAVNSCRLLVNPSLGHYHLKKYLDKPRDPGDVEAIKAAFKSEPEQLKAAFNIIGNPGKDYQYGVLVDSENLDSFERDLFREFRKEGKEGEPKTENVRLRTSEQVLVYSAPILAAKSCMSCH